jgi:hypothetical protein
MSFVGLEDASPQSRIVGLVLAGIHFAASLAVGYAAATGSHDAQWQLVWAPLALADLPVTVVLYPIGFVLFGRLFTGFQSWSDPMVAIPFLVHGVFGSALYAAIPPAISAHLKYRAARRASAKKSAA